MYESPIPKKTIVKMDLFNGLVPYIGSEWLICRDRMYGLITGSITGKLRNRTVLSLYQRFIGVRKYINELSRVIKPEEDLTELFINSCAGIITSYGEVVRATFADGKFLMLSRHIVYYAYNSSREIPKLERAVYIC